MKKIFGLLFLFLSFGCSTVEPKIEKLDGSYVSQSELTSKIQTLMDSAEVTGISIAIFNDNKVVYQKSFGYSNFEKKDSLTNKTVFYGASFSKAVFGYIVARLANDKIIELDKPLQDYLNKPLPDFEFEEEWQGYSNLKNDERYKNITARMCLSHTTGFPNWRFLTSTGFDKNGELTINTEPGKKYSYSGEGMVLLQFVIEKITGKGLEQLAREIVFDPLNMNMTSYVWQERFEDIYCNGHTIEQKVIPKDIEGDANSAGSMETTLEDYSKFLSHILKEVNNNSEVTNLLFDPNIKISSKAQFGPSAFEETKENDDIDLSYGLGWGLLKSPYSFGAFKEGHSEGFQHYSIVFPEKGTGIIILSNSDNAESIFKELLEVAIGDTFTPWKWENYIPSNYEQK
jgi:CubicO group peptidase (beta-lactamase class C family)